ncbi:MAG: hypothetical protein ABI308_07625 [Mucilaginibacter sp.]
MKKLKLQLDGIKEMLSKDQMKKVIGGDYGGGGGCATGGICWVYNGSNHQGKCGHINSTCLCVTDIGYYTPSDGSSVCWVNL